MYEQFWSVLGNKKNESIVNDKQTYFLFRHINFKQESHHQWLTLVFTSHPPIFFTVTVIKGNITVRMTFKKIYQHRYLKMITLHCSVCSTIIIIWKYRVIEKFLEELILFGRWNRTKRSIVTFQKNDRFLLVCLSNQIYCSKNILLNWNYTPFEKNRHCPKLVGK